MARVISGAGAKINLYTSVHKNLRPTTNKVKEAIFNILQFEIKNSVFLDLFAGTGQIGIEAASRGACEVFLVEKNKKSLKLLNFNVNKVKNIFKDSKIELIYSDAFKFLKYFNNTEHKKVDIAFLDPPYYSGILPEAILETSKIINKNGLILTESVYDMQIIRNENFDFKKRYKYGKTVIDLYKTYSS